MKKVVLCWLSLFLVVGLAVSAHGQTNSEPQQDDSVPRQVSPSAGAILGDLVIVRPFGIIFTALGVVGTVAALPFSIPTGSVGAVAQTLVADPFAFTFARPLGVFSPELDVPWN
jgi:hypothetical protein